MKQEVLYRVFAGRRVSQTGSGKTVNISSSGVCFTTESLLPVGTSVELSINWPVLLLDSCHLKLITHGRVIRSSEEGAVLTIDRYDFRTQGSRERHQSLHAAQGEKALKELPTDRTVGELPASIDRRGHGREVSKRPSAVDQAGGQHEGALSDINGRYGSRPDRQQRRCDCGVCPMCLDNAKWETVFNEKFADPDYYNALPIRTGSSLSWR